MPLPELSFIYWLIHFNVCKSIKNDSGFDLDQDLSVIGTDSEAVSFFYFLAIILLWLVSYFNLLICSKEFIAYLYTFVISRINLD